MFIKLKLQYKIATVKKIYLQRRLEKVKLLRKPVISRIYISRWPIQEKSNRITSAKNYWPDHEKSNRITSAQNYWPDHEFKSLVSNQNKILRK